MGIIRANQLPDGSGNLTNDDVFVFMDDPSGNGITKKISLSQISSSIFDQDLNTFNSVAFNQITISGSSGASYYVMANVDGNTLTSSDGLNWNGPYDLNMEIDHVATNGTTILAIDNDEIGYTSFSSPSGTTTVTATVSGITDIDLNQIIYGGGYFVVAGGGNDGVKTVPIYGYSSDGFNWTFKTVTGSLANTLADDDDENCEFSDIDYNGVGWNFSVTSGNEEVMGIGGGVYTTDITETFTDGEDGNYFSMVPGQQAAWNGNAWYYINSEIGSGFNANIDPRIGEWDGPYNPWASSREDLGINILSNISDTFCGGNGYLVLSDGDGHISFSSDNGQTWTYITPIPYTATITNISYVDNKYQLSLTGNTGHADGEKIIISGSSVTEYNGVYFLDDNNFLYIDFELITPWIPTVPAFSGTANLTWSHGEYIDAMDYVNGYFYIGNDNEQIARSNDLINWTIVDDRNDSFEYWDDFNGYSSGSGGGGIQNPTGNLNVTTNNSNTWVFGENGNLTFPSGSILSETNNTLSLAPPTALPGQSLVIRPTAAVWSITSSDFIEYGSPITISVSQQYGGGNYFGTVNYNITGSGVTQASLGRSLTGNMIFSGPGPETETTTWTIPANSDITEFTFTLTSVDGVYWDNIPEHTDPALYYSFESNTMPSGQYVTVTNNGISNSEHSHVHLVAGDPETVDIYLGDDDQYVKIEKDGGNVVIGTNLNNNQWTFGTNGSLTLPSGGGSIIFPDSTIQTSAGAPSNTVVRTTGNQGIEGVKTFYDNAGFGGGDMTIVSLGENLAGGSGVGLFDNYAPLASQYWYGTDHIIHYAYGGGTLANPRIAVREDTGNVGIGTRFPSSKLQVSGLITANSGNFTQSLQVSGITFPDNAVQTSAGIPSSTGLVPNSTSITNIVSISQANYDAIVTKNSSTLYVIS